MAGFLKLLVFQNDTRDRVFVCTLMLWYTLQDILSVSERWLRRKLRIDGVLVAPGFFQVQRSLISFPRLSFGLCLVRPAHKEETRAEIWTVPSGHCQELMRSWKGLVKPKPASIRSSCNAPKFRPGKVANGDLGSLWDSCIPTTPSTSSPSLDVITVVDSGDHTCETPKAADQLKDVPHIQSCDLFWYRRSIVLSNQYYLQASTHMSIQRTIFVP